MKKRNLLLISLLSVTFLSSCANNGPSTPEDDNNDDNKNEDPVITNLLSDEILNAFKSSSLEYNAKISNTNGNEDEAYTSSVLAKFSSGAYSFKETVDESGHVATDVTFYKNEDGYVITKELQFDNTVLETVMGYGSIAAIFDEHYANPFSDVTLEDLKLDEESKTYTFKSDNLKGKFFGPINYYGETLENLSLSYDEANKEINVNFETKTETYQTSVEGTFKIVQDPIEDVVPFEHESYHDEITSALKEMDEAKSFTYNITRTDLDGVYPEEKLVTYFTENAILYPADEFTGYSNPYGMAKYNDGSIRYYDVIDGKVVTGTKTEEMFDVSFSLVAPELYQKVGENTYEISNLEIATMAAMNMVDTYDEYLYLFTLGIGSPLQITLKDGHLASFSYTNTRIYEEAYVENSHINFEVTNINSTTIDHSLKFELPNVETSKASYIGSWSGENRASGYEDETHTLVIEANDKLTFDGVSATEVTFDPIEGYDFKVTLEDRELHLTAKLRDDGSLFIMDNGSVYVNVIASKN